MNNKAIKDIYYFMFITHLGLNISLIINVKMFIMDQSSV